MSSLFLCCTYYQLIVSIQIKRKLFPEDQAVLVLTNDCSGARDVAEQLQRESLFVKVIFADKKQYTHSGGVSAIHCITYGLFGLPDLSALRKWNFDRFFFFNDDIEKFSGFR